MFENRLPYGLGNPDQHSPEPVRAITDYIDPKFRESGKVAVDEARRDRDRQRAEAKAAGKTESEVSRFDDLAIRPGTTLNKLNPWTELTAEEREARIAEFRALGDQ